MAIAATGPSVPDGMTLNEAEVELILAHRAAVEQERERRIEAISHAIGSSCSPVGTSNWNGWPGTKSIARAVYVALLTERIILEK